MCEYRSKWWKSFPDPSDSLIYSFLGDLPEHARITFEGEAELMKFSSLYQIYKVKSALTSILLDCDFGNRAGVRARGAEEAHND
jgi:hypothetical protein